LENIAIGFTLNDTLSPAVQRITEKGKKSFASLGESIKRTNKDVSDTANNIKGNLNNAVSSIGSTIKRAFAAIAVGTAVKSMAELSIQAEQTRIAFTTFLGSSEAANKSIKELSQFAASTPFSKKEVVDVGKALLGFGVSADKLQPTLRAIGDISSGTGKNFKELAVIFGQIKSVGKLMGGDLMQLRQSGIPIVAELAKNYGVTEAAITEMVSKGKIGFKEVERAFQTMTGEGGMFFNLMENQSKSLGGRISALGDAFEDLGTKIGDSVIAPVLGAMVDFINEFMSNMDAVKSAFSNLSAAFQPILNSINNLGISLGIWTSQGMNGAIVAQNLANIINTYLVPVVQFAAQAFADLSNWFIRNQETLVPLIKLIAYVSAGIFVAVKAIALVRAAIAAWQVVQLALNAAMTANPIGIIIVAIGALIGAVTWAWNNIEGFKEGFIAAFQTATYVFQNFGKIVSQILSNIGKFFVETFQPFFEAIELIKKGEYSKAALAIGKGLLNVTTIPIRFAASMVTGDLLKGTGIAENLKDNFANELRKTRQEKLEEENKKRLERIALTAKKDPATATGTTMPSTGPQTMTPPDDVVKTRGKSGPESITIEFKPEINLTVHSNAKESVDVIQREIDRLIADMANRIQRPNR
jgi:tape measure domain-containing protein